MWITCGRIKLLHIIFDTTGWLSHLRTIPTTRSGSTAGAIEEHFGGGVWGGWCPDGNDDNLRQECRLEFTPPHSVHSQSVSQSVCEFQCAYVLSRWLVICCYYYSSVSSVVANKNCFNSTIISVLLRYANILLHRDNQMHAIDYTNEWPMMISPSQ